MTKDHPHSVAATWHNRHDYLPAAGHDMLLPGYDLLTRMLGMRPAYRTLVGQAELYDGAQVLEIGCGTGNLTMAAKRAAPGVDMTGLDPDPRALSRATKKARGLPGIRFEQGYAQKLPYANGSFDRVLSSMMLHHLDAEVKAAALGEAFRVLRPGGCMHIVDVVGHRLAAAHDVDVIPELLRGAGFDVATLGSRRLRMIGPVTFYRGLRHA